MYIENACDFSTLLCYNSLMEKKKHEASNGPDRTDQEVFSGKTLYKRPGSN